MTKLNWDKISTENVSIRRDKEYYLKIGSSSNEPQWEQCDYCGLVILKNKLARHHRRRHLIVTERPVVVSAGRVQCKYCGVVLFEKNIPRHNRKAHSSIDKQVTPTAELNLISNKEGLKAG